MGYCAEYVTVLNMYVITMPSLACYALNASNIITTKSSTADFPVHGYTITLQNELIAFITSLTSLC